MMKVFFCCAWMAIIAAGARADLNTLPAARVHVRYVDGVPMRFTSKLAQVMELNFTLNFNHAEGKAGIDAMLGRIAADYGTAAGPAFTIRKFVGPGNGASVGLPVVPFTPEDLQAADVIVNNNISNLTDLPSKSPAMASAFETAVRNGKSVLSFHGTEQGERGWNFYHQEFFPLKWLAHGNQVPVPVYRNEAEKAHLVLEGVLTESTDRMPVPMGTDSAGRDILQDDVPVRSIKKEGDRFAVNPLSDPRFAPQTTCLLRFDPRQLSTSDLPAEYRFRGGHAYSFILKVGQGRSAYLPCGHDNSELSTGITSFDGGTGDWERYYAQMLFFLAGYRAEACGAGADCEGLPVADSADHLTGKRYSAGTPIADPHGLAAGFRGGSVYRTFLSDLSGRIVASHAGPGDPMPFFRRSGLAPGVYFLHSRNGKARVRVSLGF